MSDEPMDDLEAYGPAIFELFRDVFGEWRWRLRTGTRVLAMAAEAHVDRAVCLERLLWVRANAAVIAVEGGGDDGD